MFRAKPSRLDLNSAEFGHESDEPATAPGTRLQLTVLNHSALR